jgi:hypothetical protein
MKKLTLTTLLCWLTLAAIAAQTDLKVTLSDFVGTAAANRTVYVQNLTTPTASSTATVIGTRLTYISDGSGIFYISNCTPNSLYSFSVQAPPSRTDFTVEILETDTGLINAHSNMVAFSTSTFPAGSVAWSAVTSDLRYLRSSASASNVVWPVAGNNVTMTTNGFAVTVNAAAGAGTLNANQFDISANGSVTNIKSGSLQTNNIFAGAPFAVDGALVVSNRASGGSSASLYISGNTANGGASDQLSSDPNALTVTLGGSGRFLRTPNTMALGTSNYVLGSLSVASNIVFTPRTIVLSTNNGDISLIIGTNGTRGMNWVLMPGIYWCSNWMKCPTNGSIVGSGAGSTILIDMFTNGFPAPMIACSDYGYVADMTITNFYYDTPDGVFASCIGTHQSLAQVSGNAVVAGAGGYTNFLGERLILYGGSDTYYNRHTNNCYGTLRNCKLYGPWDIVTAFNTSTQQYDFWYCDFNHTAVASHGTQPFDIFVADPSPRARFRSYYCNFFKTNGIAGNDYYVNLGAPSIQSADYFYCTFTNANPGVEKFFTGTTTTPFTFVGCNVSLEEVGDSIDPSTGLQLGTNVAHTWNLAGDSANGITVSATTSWPNKADFRVTAADGGYFSDGLSAGTITNRASAGSHIQITDANGKLKDVTASSAISAVAGDGSPIFFGGGLILSGGTLTAVGSGGSLPGWTTNGNNASPIDILGTTNQMVFRMVAFSNEVAVFDTNSTIRIGRGHIIQTNALDNGVNDESIFGGYSNIIQGASSTSIILGGHENVIGAATIPTTEAVILSGRNNTNYGNNSLIWGYGNTIGQGGPSFVGGHGNAVCDTAGGVGNFIGSGTGNYIGTNVLVSVIAGGQFNNISNNVGQGVIGGGYQNSVSGNSYGVIPGGFQNRVNGLFGFAAGNRAKAMSQGSYVWGDSTSADVTDNGTDSYTVRASGGRFHIGGGAKTYSFQSNTVAANGGVFYTFSSSTLFGGFYAGTNAPGNSRGTDIANGAIGGTNLIQVDAPTVAKALEIGTNGSTHIAGPVVITGSGSNYSGGNLNINGTINNTGATNSSLTANRIILTDANKAQVSAAGSGSVPVNADGTATTVAQMETLMLATNDFRYLKRYPYKRLAFVVANGAASGSTIMGDAVTSGGGDTVSAVAPTSTEGVLRRQTSDTTNPNDTGVSGNLNYRSGRNIYFATTVKLDSVATKRYFFGVTDQTITTMGGADNPAGNYAGFMLTTNTGGINILTITKDNSTQTSTTTSLAQDTSIHLYEVVFNDGTPNVVFRVDGVTVATHTTHLPSAGTNMRYVVGGRKYDGSQRLTDFEYIQIESDR